MRNSCGICMEKDRCQGMNQEDSMFIIDIQNKVPIFEQLKKEDLQSSGKSKKYLERTRF